MKTTILSMAIVAFAFMSQSFTTIQNTIDDGKPVSKANIVWKAYKVTGSHQGTVDLKSGTLLFDDSKLTGGSFEIDMTSITCTDMEGEYKGKLEGHLKSDDFFGVEKHALSSLEITKVKSTGKNSYDVSGDITIKGITQPIDFQVSIYGSKATANLKIDRTKFDIRYGSNSFFDGLKDKAIYDEFDLVIDLDF